jgi:hypothetical protein
VAHDVVITICATGAVELIVSLNYPYVLGLRGTLSMEAKNSQAYGIVDVNVTNIDARGLFCLQSKKNTDGYNKKIGWAKERFKEGLHVKLLMVNEGSRRGLRTRGFIEYIPGKNAWRGIDADGYMVIHCIWVVGQHKGHGYG